MYKRKKWNSRKDISVCLPDNNLRVISSGLFGSWCMSDFLFFVTNIYIYNVYIYVCIYAHVHLYIYISNNIFIKINFSYILVHSEVCVCFEDVPGSVFSYFFGVLYRCACHPVAPNLFTTVTGKDPTC